MNAKNFSIKNALIVSTFWIGLALLFNYSIFVYYGKDAALNFFAGYLIEKSLSIDNLFVFLTLFNYFRTPVQYQHKVLFWGILGAIAMRAFFIFFGVALVQKLHWILYVFALFLLYISVKMALPKSKEFCPENNWVLTFLKKWLPITPDYVGNRFFTKLYNRWWATPLFVVLAIVETTDLVFALDSIPAVMAITLDPFIIYTSNIFALVGLRSLYFALAGLMHYFHLLNYGLATILGFVGFKMLLTPFIKIPIIFALGFIIAALTITMIFSLLFPKKS